MARFRQIAEVDPREIHHRERETLSIAQRRDQRGAHREKKADRDPQIVAAETEEVDGDDADEDRQAVRQHHEHQRVALVRLKLQVARRAALVDLEAAAEELALAAARAAAAPASKKDVLDHDRNNIN